MVALVAPVAVAALAELAVGSLPSRRCRRLGLAAAAPGLALLLPARSSPAGLAGAPVGAAAFAPCQPKKNKKKKRERGEEGELGRVGARAAMQCNAMRVVPCMGTHGHTAELARGKQRRNSSSCLQSGTGEEQEFGVEFSLSLLWYFVPFLRQHLCLQQRNSSSCLKSGTGEEQEREEKAGIWGLIQANEV